MRTLKMTENSEPFTVLMCDLPVEHNNKVFRDKAFGLLIGDDVWLPVGDDRHFIHVDSGEVVTIEGE